MQTVDTVFANNFDFYMSFGIGLGLAIGVIGSLDGEGPSREARKAKAVDGEHSRTFSTRRPGRGDINFWISIAIYVFSTLSYVGCASGWSPISPGFFPAYGFVYTPVMSYITARMEGIAGQFVSLPLVREASFIAGAKVFGYQGIEIWYAPIPIHNYGEATVHFRDRSN
jgi:hypothetical protein